MRYKLFVGILFRNIKLIFLYFILLFIAIYLVLKQMDCPQVEMVVLTMTGSFLVLGSLILYIIKGMAERAGILKALGIADEYVTGTFFIGFGIFITAVCLMDYIAAILTLDLSLSAGFTCIAAIGSVMFIITNVSFGIAYKKIFPKY